MLNDDFPIEDISSAIYSPVRNSVYALYQSNNYVIAIIYTTVVLEMYLTHCHYLYRKSVQLNWQQKTDML